MHINVLYVLILLQYINMFNINILYVWRSRSKNIQDV